eukprot:Hpha_TRINITY_DN15761_c8_g1::TRINITY_DN15761_c8_g1_i1::g.38649::m.38649
MGKSSVAAVVVAAVAIAAGAWFHVHSTQSTPENVLVIGGGFAGLIAARDLREAGVPVVVVEGRHKVGGRVWTDNRWGFPVDVCATFIHGIENNPVAHEAARYNIPIVPVDYSKVKVWNAKGESMDPKEVRKVKEVYRSLRKRVFQARDRRVGDTDLRTAFEEAREQLNISLTKREEEILSWHFYWEIVQDQVAQLREMSLMEFDASVMYEGRDAVIKGGMQRLVDAVAEGIPARVNSTVTQVEYSPHGVNVQLASGEVLRGTRAVIALPLGVMKNGSVSFIPPLPRWKRRSLHRLGCSATFKMALRFPSVFWPEEAQFLGKIGEGDLWGEGEHLEFINMGATAHQATGVLVMEVEGDFARKVAAMTPQQRTARVMRELRTMFGDAIPDPVDTLSANYVSDPLVGGCGFSFWPPLASGDDNLEAAEGVHGRLFFAGEYTTPRDYGNLHGAILEGGRAGREALAAISEHNSPLRLLQRWYQNRGRSTGPGKKRSHFTPPWCPAPCQ